MRDVHDTMTLTVEGVEPLPPPPSKTPTIAERREACRYTGPREIVSCRSCHHRHSELLHTGSLYESERNRCKKHDFTVELGAICSDHAPLVPAAQRANERKH